MKQHWLVRPGTIRLLWLVFAGILALTVIAGLFVDRHGVFGADGFFAFNAWYGFICCIGLVLVAKLLGYMLQRRDDYYDRD